MAEYPAMPLWTDAYLGDTTHLTTIEHGAYLLLLMAMWRSNGTLPVDDRKLARLARLTPGQWSRIKPTLWPFFTVTSDGITQGRLTDELVAVRQYSASQSNRSKARWLKNKGTAHPGAYAETPVPLMPERSPADAPTPLPTEQVEAVAAGASEPTWNPDRLLSEILSILGLKEGRTSRYWMPPGASIHVWRWHTDQNLTCPEILEVITSSHEAHQRSPPQGPKAFDGAIALFASIKFAPPPPDIIPPPNGAFHGRVQQNRPDRRADESERLSRILDAAARGTT